MGGGIGHSLAEWIAHGEPGIDLHEMDPRRFGAYANKRYSSIKSREAFANNFGINYPDWEWPAARPAKTSPCYEKMKQHGAVFGATYGWEIPTWFAPTGVERRDRHSYRRSNYFEHVAQECRAVRERVGTYDLTPAGKYEVSGPGAAAWLDRRLASRLPDRPGRSALCYLLTSAGHICCELTITRLSENHFYLVGSTIGERHSFDILTKALPSDGSVMLQNVTSGFGALAIVGPRARDVLGAMTDGDLSNAAFPWWSAQTLTIGLASAVRTLRINYVGECGRQLPCTRLCRCASRRRWNEPRSRCPRRAALSPHCGAFAMGSREYPASQLSGFLVLNPAIADHLSLRHCDIRLFLLLITCLTAGL